MFYARGNFKVKNEKISSPVALYRRSTALKNTSRTFSSFVTVKAEQILFIEDISNVRISRLFHQSRENNSIERRKSVSYVHTRRLLFVSRVNIAIKLRDF